MIVCLPIYMDNIYNTQIKHKNMLTSISIHWNYQYIFPSFQFQRNEIASKVFLLINYELNELLFGLLSKGKHRLRSYSLQIERKLRYGHKYQELISG